MDDILSTATTESAITESATAKSVTAFHSLLPRSVYLHVPFCRHRCGYCDFTLIAQRDDLITAYLDAIRIELSTIPQQQEIDTLFLGGGTPTHLSAEQLSQLFGLLNETFQLATNAEVSIEGNPLDFSDPKTGAERLAVLTAVGVNRISLGVQSFDETVLTTLERDHRQADIYKAVEQIRQQIENLSLDLIFGVPGQSMESWQKTLDETISLNTPHVSTYGLTFEKGTSFWSRRRQGTLQNIPEEIEREMYAVAIDQLTTAGHQQYELSNFAQPDRQCQHNEIYWTGLPYYGFGPGAASYLSGQRIINHRSVTRWINQTRAGKSAIGEIEQLPPEELARERIVIGLRRTKGILKQPFHEQTGYTVNELIGEVIRRHQQTGLLEETETAVRLTYEGRFLADTVFVDCL